MRFKWNRHYLGWGLTAFIVIVASILVSTMLTNYKEIAAAVGNFFGALKPIFLGLIFAYLLAPVVKFFETRCYNKLFAKNEKRTVPAAEAASAPRYANLRCYVKNKPRRILSIFSTVLLLLLIIVSLCFAVLPQLVQTVIFIIDHTSEYIGNMNEWINNVFQNFPQAGEYINGLLNEASTMLKSFLTTDILPQMLSYVGSLTSGIMSVFGVIMNLLIGLVVAIYCLYSKELFSAQMKKLLYVVFNIKHANKIIEGARMFHKAFGSFITGTLIDSFVVGCITFIVTTIFNVPFALLVSVIMGLTNIIPYFGPFIGIVPCLFFIFMESPVMCLVFIAIVIVLQNLNGNIISPKIIGQSTGLSSFWVIFAILAGQAVFGFWGLIIGIPIFAVLYGVVKTFISGKLSEKGLPHDSDSYSDIYSIEPNTLIPVSLTERLDAEREAERKAAALKDTKSVINGFKARFNSDKSSDESSAKQKGKGKKQ